MLTESRPLTILQVEDSPSDAALTAHALQEGHFLYSIQLASNGNHALQFLRHGEGFTDAPRPDLILLDLGLPGMNGQDVLKAIKSDDSLKAIPVVVFTTLATEESQLLAYANYANSYVVKPVDPSGFTNIVQSIVEYWSQTSSSLARRPHTGDAQVPGPRPRGRT